jgi:predicted metal-dependent hydrolase
MITAGNFKQEVGDWIKEVGIRPKEIHIRTMKRKWASCSSKGRLTFSYDLLNQTKGVRANAIVHEILHLRYPNHGKMFHTLLKVYLKKNNIIH